MTVIQSVSKKVDCSIDAKCYGQSFNSSKRTKHYEITKIVRALWLAERCVCMRVCKHGCDVKIFCFSCANHASTNLKKVLSWKTQQLYYIYPFPRWLKLEKSLETCCVNFFRLSWHFKREKPVFWQASFLQNKFSLRVQDSCTRQCGLVRISLLIYVLNKRVFLFFSGKLFYKSNRKLFSCVCISWYKHSRGWENSRQLCKTVSNSPNPSHVFIRLYKHGKHFLLLN